MKAYTARKIARKNSMESLPHSEYESIMRSIRYAVGNGEFKVWIESDLIHELVINKLRGDGYKVVKRFLIGGYNISWK